MATVSMITNTVFGNMRAVQLNITTAATEENVAIPGLKRVISHQWSQIGGTQSFSCMVIRENITSTTTVALGSIGYSNAVNGSIYRFTVYGV